MFAIKIQQKCKKLEKKFIILHENDNSYETAIFSSKKWKQAKLTHSISVFK